MKYWIITTHITLEWKLLTPLRMVTTGSTPRILIAWQRPTYIAQTRWPLGTFDRLHGHDGLTCVSQVDGNGGHVRTYTFYLATTDKSWRNQVGTSDLTYCMVTMD